MYQYSELNKFSHEIRLVTLYPAHDDDSTITCSLRTAALDEFPEYKALSYCWGGNSRPCKIVCNGEDLFVTSNLHQAMLRLRTSIPLTYWIDALCINQDSVDERNHQVPMMTRIYGQASHVVIWLGETNAESSIAISLLWRLAENYEIYRCNPSDKMALNSKLPESQVHWDALQRLFEREWFSRAWVWQEVALSARDETTLAMLGEHNVPWKSLVNTCSAIWEMGLVRRFRDLRWQIIIHMQDIRQQMVTKLSVPLSTIVYLTYGKTKATNPRDMLFAFFGIAKDASKAIRCDYRKPVDVLYTEVSEYLLSDSYRLCHFAMIKCCKETSIRLPSWALNFNWDTPHWRMCFHQKDEYEFRVAGNSQSVITLPKHTAAPLLIRGCRIGSISIASEPLREVWNSARPEAHLEIAAKVRDKWAALLGPRRMDTYPQCSRGRSYLEAFSSTLVCSYDLHYTTRDHGVEKMFIQVLGLLGSLSEKNQDISQLSVNQEVADYIRAVAERIYCRSFFVDSVGRIGIGPECTAQGDEVCVFLGSQVPHLIRPRGNGSYEILGECYVHGIMNGELFEEETGLASEDIALE